MPRLVISLASLILAILAGVGIGAFRQAEPARAQSIIICWAASTGSPYLYSSYTSCPTWGPAGALYETSTLYKFDPYVLLDYYYVEGTLSGCGGCIYDVAFDTHSGGSGSYWVAGSHSVVLPAYYPGYAPTNYFFSY